MRSINGALTIFLYTLVLALLIPLAEAIEITTGSLPDAYQTVPYSATLQAASVGTSPIGWTVSMGSLPSGLVIDLVGNQGDYTTTISGTPTTLGMYTFTVLVTDSSTPTPQTDEKLFVINVSERSLRFSACEQTSGGHVYLEWWSESGATYTVESSFGPMASQGSMSWTLEASGVASGGDYTDWTDSDPTTPTGEKYYRVSMEVGEFRIVGEYGDGEYFGDYYDDTVTAEGGVPPYGPWILESGFLPIGLELDYETGVISGVPLLTGDFDFEVGVYDSDSPPSFATKEFTITIY
jgi:hypothetical protein